MPGPEILLGCPGSGKTTEAVKRAKEESARTGYPILAVDPARAAQFLDWPRAATLKEAIEKLWKEGSHVAWTPENAEEFDSMMSAARAGRRIIIVIDELKFCLPSSRSMSLPFQLAIRLWRHADLPAVYATTQSYSDAARPLRAAVSNWVIFRMTAPGDLKALQEDFGLDADEISQLPKFTFKEQRSGF